MPLVFFTANEQTVTYIYTKYDEIATITLPNYVPKPTKPNNTNKLTGTNSQTAKDKNQQKATKPLSGGSVLIKQSQIHCHKQVQAMKIKVSFPF